MKVIHFNRKKRLNSNYSIEGIYSSLRNTLNDKIKIATIECPFTSNGFFRRLYNCIYAAFKQEDINHVTGDVHYLNLFFKKKGSVLTIHDCGPLYRLKGIKHFILKLFWYTIPVSRAEYIVAVSKSTKTEILKYVKCEQDKIKVIYNPVSPLFVRADKEFNKGNPVILQVGTALNKNLSRLIKALQGVNCKLVIIGKLSTEQLEKLAANKIDYKNYIGLTGEEVFEQYKACDILAFVSTHEGFGMPIIEANAVGRPVITGNLLSMPEVAGDAACIVDPFNSDEIKKGIQKIINDDIYRNDLIEKGYRNVQKFNRDIISNQYFELYWKLFLDREEG